MRSNLIKFVLTLVLFVPASVNQASSYRVVPHFCGDDCERRIENNLRQTTAEIFIVIKEIEITIMP